MLAFLPLPRPNPKSDFTPLCASVRVCGMTPFFWSRSPCPDRPSGGCSRAAIPSPNPFLSARQREVRQNLEFFFKTLGKWRDYLTKHHFINPSVSDPLNSLHFGRKCSQVKIFVHKRECPVGLVIMTHKDHIRNL